MNCSRSPSNLGVGPLRTVEAWARSDLSELRQRAKTASPMRVTGMPRSSALMAVHLPVPFWPAESRIFSTRALPSSSLKHITSRVISMRNESRTPLFHLAMTSPISSLDMPRPRFMMSYACSDSRGQPLGVRQVALEQHDGAWGGAGRGARPPDKSFTDLGDELHVAVLDPVVDHLDIVAGAFIAHPIAAGLAVALCRDALEDVLDEGPGLLVTTRHQTGAVARALLATGHARAHEADALLGERLGPTVRVRIVRVAAVDENVALLQQRQQGLDELVHGRAGLHQEHHPPGFLELAHELLRRVGANDRLALGFVLEEVIDLRDGAVVRTDGVSVIGHVQDEVLAHDGQADEANVGTGSESRRLANIDAGESGSVVSKAWTSTVAFFQGSD